MKRSSPAGSIALMIVAWSSLGVSSQALATTSTFDEGFTNFMELFSGSPGEQKLTSTCSASDSDSSLGVLGFVNNFFCHLEKDLLITAETPVAGVTGTYGSTMHVHVEVGQPSNFSVGGVAYTNEGKMWVCQDLGSVKCYSGSSGPTTADASKFNRAVYIAWTSNTSGSINLGTMIVDTAAFTNTTGDILALTYDVGTADTTTSISAQYVNNHASGTLSDGTSYSIANMATSMTATQSVVSENLTLVAGGTTAAIANSERFLATVNLSTLGGFSYLEGPGTTGDGTAVFVSADLTSSSAPASSAAVCSSLALNSALTDYTYTETSSCTLTLGSFADTPSDVGNYTSTSIATWPSDMAANPTTL